MKNNLPPRDALAYSLYSIGSTIADSLALCLAVRGVTVYLSYLYIAHVNASISVMFKYLCIRNTNPIHASSFLPTSRQTRGIGKKADRAA